MKALILLVLIGCQFKQPDKLDETVSVPNLKRGKTLVFAYGCAVCHTIGGVNDYPGSIGPPITNWAKRKYIAGKLPNRMSQLILWLKNPKAYKKQTAMPNLGITEDEAVDIAAYLYSQ